MFHAYLCLKIHSTIKNLKAKKLKKKRDFLQNSYLESDIGALAGSLLTKMVKIENFIFLTVVLMPQSQLRTIITELPLFIRC